MPHESSSIRQAKGSTHTSCPKRSVACVLPNATQVSAVCMIFSIRFNCEKGMMLPV